MSDQLAVHGFGFKIISVRKFCGTDVALRFSRFRFLMPSVKLAVRLAQIGLPILWQS